MSIQNLTVYLYTATKNTALNYLSARAKENMVDPFDFFSVFRRCEMLILTAICISQNNTQLQQELSPVT